jgi:hypothetical protein
VERHGFTDARRRERDGVTTGAARRAFGYARAVSVLATLALAIATGQGPIPPATPAATPATPAATPATPTATPATPTATPGPRPRSRAGDAPVHVATAAETRFGRSGDFIVTLRRVFPPIAYSLELKNGAIADDAISYGSGGTPSGPYRNPRLGIDVSATRHLTIGTDLFGQVTLARANEQPVITLLGLAPRVGWIVPLGDIVAFWPSMGPELTMRWETARTGAGIQEVERLSRRVELGANVEAQLVVTPLAHFGILVGLSLDVPIVGRFREETRRATGPAVATGSLSSLRVAFVTGLLSRF